MGYFRSPYNANPVPVMKTGIPCSHILTGKTCFNDKEPALITGILFTLQGTCFQNSWFPARPLFYPVRDCNLPTLRAAGTSEDIRTGPHHVFRIQLTLSQPGGQIMSTTVLQSSPCYNTFWRPCFVVLKCAYPVTCSNHPDQG